jgi:phospholipase/carboxylesterase
MIASLRTAPLAASILLLCTGSLGEDTSFAEARAEGGGRCAPGVHELAVGNGRRARMRVTPPAGRGKRALVLVLHGAGGGANDGLYAFRGGWDARGLVLVAPSSEGGTWSIPPAPDTDLRTVNRALERAFARCRVDRRWVAVGGFSDGATYALSLGLAHGDIFRAVMALSPGGLIVEKLVGKPRIFIAHGNRDNVLSFSRTRDLIVPELRGMGYKVTFKGFPGGHKAPEAVSRAAVRWFLDR